MILLKHGAGHPGLICYGAVRFVTKLHFPNRSNFFIIIIIQSKFQEPRFTLVCTLL